MSSSPMNWFIDLGLVPSPAVILDEQGRIAFTNQAWQDFAKANQYRGKGFIGRDYVAFCESVVGVERIQAQAVAVAVRELLANTRDMFETTYPCHSRDAKRWFKCVAFRHGGHVVVSHVDISEECRNDHSESGVVSEVLKSTQLFHDLRSPLTTIIGYAQACQSYPDDRLKQVREGHALIEMAGGRMLDIITEITELIQEYSDNAPMEETPVQVSKLVEGFIEQVQPQAEPLKLNLCHKIREDLVILADEKKLIKVLSNLMSNAMKYNVENGRVIVSAALNASGGMLLRVTDTGLGVAEDKQADLFTPFTRGSHGEDWQGREGVGLGLVIVRELCERHDATIEVESKEGEGSSFTIIFPAWRTVRKKRSKAVMYDTKKAPAKKTVAPPQAAAQGGA